MEPVVSIPHRPPVQAAAPAPQTKPTASVNTPHAPDAPLLAKLEPAPQANEGRTTVQRTPEPTSGIAATQPAKASPPAPTPIAEPVAPAATATPAPPAKPDTVWEIVPADKTLSAALARWAGAAGWQLVWELQVDYAVETRTTVPGTFEEAVDAVARSMGSAETAMQAIFYKGNKVLRIVAKGSE
jgi:hypothetical protein